MKNCQLCGTESKLDKHHIDYEKKITINVCKRCHGLLTSLIKKLPRNNENPVDLKCKCGYGWTYKGRNPYYATCPSCLIKVRISG